MGRGSRFIDICNVARLHVDGLAAEKQSGLAPGEKVLRPIAAQSLAGTDVDVLAIGGDPDRDASGLAGPAPDRREPYLALTPSRIEDPWLKSRHNWSNPRVGRSIPVQGQVGARKWATIPAPCGCVPGDFCLRSWAARSCLPCSARPALYGTKGPGA